MTTARLSCGGLWPRSASLGPNYCSRAREFGFSSGGRAGWWFLYENVSAFFAALLCSATLFAADAGRFRGANGQDQEEVDAKRAEGKEAFFELPRWAGRG